MVKVFIMRGVPGSGKSTVSGLLANLTKATICSTDSFFIKDGVYTFDRNKLGHYHHSNQKLFKECLEAGVNAIVDNTNITYKEIKEYLVIADNFLDIKDVVVVEPATEWCKDANECFKRNTHGVPLETIQRMLSNFDSPNTLLSKIERDFGVRPRYMRISVEN